MSVSEKKIEPKKSKLKFDLLLTRTNLVVKIEVYLVAAEV